MTVATLGSAADAWSRRAPFDYKKMVLQLAECSGPAFLMAAATLLVAEARMCEREFGPLDNGAKPDLDKRLAGIFDAAGPAPTHAQPLGLTTSRYSPLLSCSLPSSMRKRTRKRPPTCGSVSATSTGCDLRQPRPKRSAAGDEEAGEALRPQGSLEIRRFAEYRRNATRHFS